MIAITEFLSCSGLADQALLSRVREIARQDATLTATLLAHLGEVDARRLYLSEGHPSLFDYCTRGLGYSEAGAQKRSQAARLCRRLPQVLVAVAEGRVHLSGVCLLAPHLTAENVHGLLDAAAGLSKRDIESLIHRTFEPTHIAPASATPRSAPGQVALDLTGTAEPHINGASAAETPPPSTPPRAMTPSRTKLPAPRPLTVRTTPSFLAKLEKARALASHSIRGGDTALVLERALDVLIATLEKARFGAPKRPAPAPSERTRPVRPVPSPTRRSRRTHIPAPVRRAVFERDNGCCTFVGDTGHRCGTRFGLHLHHVIAWALGGSDTVDNLTLYCAAHNQLAADRDGLPRPAPDLPRGRPPDARPHGPTPTGRPQNR